MLISKSNQSKVNPCEKQNCTISVKEPKIIIIAALRNVFFIKSKVTNRNIPKEYIQSASGK